MRFAYADPPYFGQGKKRYGFPEWDTKARHFALVDQLVEEYPDGWALSCGSADLRWLLPRCPEKSRVAPWTKTWHQIRPTAVQWAWEPIIFCGGRKGKVKPMVRDWVQANATRQKGLCGAKPPEVNAAVLQLLNFRPGDTLDDLFPGTGGMAAALRDALGGAQ